MLTGLEFVERQWSRGWGRLRDSTRKLRLLRHRAADAVSYRASEGGGARGAETPLGQALCPYLAHPPSLTQIWPSG